MCSVRIPPGSRVNWKLPGRCAVCPSLSVSPTNWTEQSKRPPSGRNYAWLNTSQRVFDVKVARLPRLMERILGFRLKLTPAKGQSEFLVIDHVERPIGN